MVIIWIGVTVLLFTLFTQGIGAVILLVINGVWFGTAYMGHLNYPPIEPWEALFWTAVWSPGGVLKFIQNRGRE